jgi:hypothetical protein
MEPFPFVDVHSKFYRSSRTEVWQALQHWVHKLTQPAPAWFVTLWKLEPQSGFAITQEVVGEKIVLRGDHRFSSYELTFAVSAEADGFRVAAQTNAQFHGVPGSLYRAMVIGSGGHTVIVRWVLYKIGTELN